MELGVGVPPLVELDSRSLGEFEVGLRWLFEVIIHCLLGI